MKIGPLTRATGVSARSLRYYEQQGLLTADRTAGGQREYRADAADRVSLITSLLAAGLSTSSIYDVLPCITEASIRTPALAARLREELSRVDAQLTALMTTRQILAELVSRYADTPDDSPAPAQALVDTREVGTVPVDFGYLGHRSST